MFLPFSGLAHHGSISLLPSLYLPGWLWWLGAVGRVGGSVLLLHDNGISLTGADGDVAWRRALPACAVYAFVCAAAYCGYYPSLIRDTCGASRQNS